MSRHVVFGTGQVGQAVISQLVARGHQVVAVNRSGRGDLPGAEVIGADATDPSVTTAICADADVVYFCLNAVHYERWVAEFPPLQRGVLAGAERAGARLVCWTTCTPTDHPTDAAWSSRSGRTRPRPKQPLGRP